jgi:leucyl aminopeptidase
MEFRCSTASLGELPCDGLAIGLLSGAWQEQLQHLLPQLATQATALLERRQFTAKAGELVQLNLAGISPSLLLIVGLGEPEPFNLEALRQGAAQLAKASRGSGCQQLGLVLPLEAFAPEQATTALVQAVRLALFQDQRFRSEQEPGQDPGTIWLLGLAEDQQPTVRRSEVICSGVELARQLVAAPPNLVNALSLEATARTLAEQHGLQLTVLDADGCRQRGMGAYLAVAQGASVPPRFLHLVLPALGPVQRRLVLVGKALTFDSGGYNLKAGAGSQIEMMKYDMGGAGAVLGAARSLAEQRPQGVEVHVIAAATENMVSAEAIHPGAVVTASNGKTIEINNTDAEGRLTLADALVYASALRPDAIVDLATLTGACVIALGDEIAGLWTGNDALAAQLSEASQRAGEQLWRMPMHSSYREGLKSGIADMKNTGPRPGGSITAALFLKEFVDPDIAWAHIDIAGPVWSEKGRSLDPAGATGFGVRTLVEWIHTIAMEAKEGLSRS